MAVLSGVLDEAVYNLKAAPALAAVVTAVPLGVVGFNALLLFYGIRLRHWVRRRPLAEVIDQLRKFRSVCAPLFVLTLLQLVAGQTDDLSVALPFLAGSVVCCAGCGVTLLESRRVAWDLALAAGASLTTGGGPGFLVLAALPARVAGSAAGPVAVLPIEQAWDRPAPAPGAPAGADASAVADWEKLLYGLLLAAIVLYVLQLPAFFGNIGTYTSNAFWREFWDMATGTPLRTPRGMVYPALANATANPQVTLGLILAAILSGVFAVTWVGWCAACLTFGPRLRRSAVWFAALSVAFTVAASGLAFYQQNLLADLNRGSVGLVRSWQSLEPGLWGLAARTWNLGGYTVDSNSYLSHRREILRRAAGDVALPLLVLFVITRPPVKNLFDHRPRRVRGGDGGG